MLSRIRKNEKPSSTNIFPTRQKKMKIPNLSLLNKKSIYKKENQKQNVWSDCVVQGSVGPLTSNSTLSNEFKVLHDKDKMDYCGGYSEANEKEENVASGNVAHDFDLGSNESEQKKNTEKISKNVKQNKNVGTNCEAGCKDEQTKNARCHNSSPTYSGREGRKDEQTKNARCHNSSPT